MRPGDDYAEYDLSPGALRIIQDAAPRPALPALVVGLVTSLYLAGMRLADFPAHVAPGDWHGFSLLPEDQVPGILPPLWSMCLGFIQLIGVSPTHAAPALAILSNAVAGGTVAMIAVLLMQHGLRGVPGATWVSAATAIGAACVFAVSTPASIARYSAGPESLNAALALLAVFCFLLGYGRPGLPLSLLAAAVLLGAACVEQPLFLMLAVVIFFAQLLLGEEDQKQIARLGMILFGLFFVIAWTVLLTLRDPVDGRTLLAHLLQQTYPSPSFMPATFPVLVGSSLRTSTVTLLVVFALGACFFQRVRAQEIVLLLIAAALLGPAIPFLANPPEPRLIPQEFLSPILAAAGLLVSAGFAGAGVLFAHTRLNSRFLLPLFAFSLLLSAISLNEIANRDTKGAIAGGCTAIHELTVSAPDGTLLITGQLNLASTLWAMQATEDFRKDLRVLPVTWLTNRLGRAAANKILGPEFTLAEEFPTPADIDRWREALPLHIATLNAGDPDRAESDLLPFALWDVVAQEALHDPVYFAGVDAPWLLARATPAGHLLAYPTEGAQELRPKDPLNNWDAFPTPLTDVFERLQACNADAAGARDEMTWTGEPIRAWTDDPMPELWTKANGDLKTRLGKAVAEANGKLTDEIKTETDQLWKHDRLFQLRTFYEAFTAAPNAEAEAWYQLAAVYAQLGQWERTGDALNKWLEKVTDGNGPPLGRLAGDGRFTLFQQRSSALADVR
jgi:hypothetical protein